MGETKEEGENGEDVCGSAGREQDERNRNMIDESLTDSPESSFFLTRAGADSARTCSC